MRTDDYECLDGLSLAELIHRGEVQPVELMACALRLAEQRNAPLNALCYLRGDDALEQARRASLILTPTLTQLPVPLGTLSMVEDFETFRRKAGRYTVFLAIINASGQPAANVPLHWSADGLPVGAQLIGRFGAEDMLLRLSAQMETAAPWIGRYHRPAA